MHRLISPSLVLILLLLLAPASPVTAQDPEAVPGMPLSNSPSASYSLRSPLTFAQQKARFESEQRSMRMEWNNWIGYSPLRPNMNASYMSNGLQLYYIPNRSVIVSSGNTRSWYW